MCRKIHDTTHYVTLNLDVWVGHFADKRYQPAELDDKKLVVN